MKTYLLLILLIYNTVESQTTFGQESGNQLDYYKSNLNDLKDENGNSIFDNSTFPDSLIMTGEAASNYFGYSVSSAGDVNGDGYSDIIVGAYGYNSDTGRAYIFYGGLSMNNVADIIMTGESGYFFGYSVSTAGDVNRDGYSDVIVGAYGYNASIGRAYIFFGGPSMNNVADVILTGEAINNEFGYSVSTAGDVNGDGYSDVIVGAYNYTGNVVGRAYIFYGGSNMNNIADVIMTGETLGYAFGISVSTAGDVNGDGYSDVIVGGYGYSSYTGRAYIFYGGSSMNNIADVTMTGEATNNYFGWSVSTAGDVNGDGYSDVIVGAYGYSSFTGQAYVFYGGSPMNDVADVTMIGEAANNGFGFSVSTAGDVNGDGYSDVIVSAYGYSASIGRAYIFFGGPSMNNTADITMTGEAANNYFGKVSTAGDVNGDGYSDVIVGAFGYNSETGRAYLYNGMPKPELLNPINNSINNSTIINFRWRKLNTAIYYILNISTDSAFNNIVVNDTISIDTSKIVSGFQRNTKYFWRVRTNDKSGVMHSSRIWNFTTIPPIYLNLKVLMEGMYYSLFNQLSRKDTVKVFLRNATSPYEIIDSAKSVIDSITFSSIFNFNNSSTGTYYIVVKHFNCIETWSKPGGEILINDGYIYNYDFTTSNTQAYGNNMKRKGTKYCIYSGDVNQSGFMDGSDFILVENDAVIFREGLRLPADLNGDNIVDGSDFLICDNNVANYIGVVRP